MNDINQTEVNLKKWASEKEGNTDTPKEKTVVWELDLLGKFSTS